MVTLCINSVQYERGCTVQVRHIRSTREDVQYESGTFSVKAMMCSVVTRTRSGRAIRPVDRLDRY